MREAIWGLVVTMREEHCGRREGPPPEDKEEDVCLEDVHLFSGQWAWIWPGEVLKQVGHLYREQLTWMCLSFLHWKQVS